MIPMDSDCQCFQRFSPATLHGFWCEQELLDWWSIHVNPVIHLHYPSEEIKGLASEPRNTWDFTILSSQLDQTIHFVVYQFITQNPWNVLVIYLSHFDLR